MSIFDRFMPNTTASRREQRKRQVSQLIAQLMENEQADLKRFPGDSKHWKPFLPILQNALEQYGEFDAEEPIHAAVHFFVTEDRMRAFACMFPPLNGGEELHPGTFGKELLRSKISAGIDEEVSFACLAKRQYLHLIPIARGTWPQEGTDGRIEELFEHRPVYVVEVREGTAADFRDRCPVQLVQRGDPICRIIPSTPGRDGMDVFGQVLPCRHHGRPVEVPIGLNTALSEDGLYLEATENGAVFDKDGVLYVQTAVVRMDSLQKDDKLVWLAYIRGDVPEGIKVSSTNHIVVMGEVRGAEIHAKGSVRVQGGIRKGSRIEARGQVLAPVIESSYVKAGKDIFAEEIKDSDVTSGGNVFVTGGKGWIHGGVVRAVEGIECIQVGSPQGDRNEIFLGYSQELTEQIDQISNDIEELQESLDKLWKNILKLRRGGEYLSLEKRERLAQLLKQKTAYEECMTALKKQLQEAQEKRRIDHNREMLCQQMYPLTVVHIGTRVGEFSYSMSDCRFHIASGQVRSK